MIERILLIDVEISEDKNNPTLQLYTHHPIGLLYIASFAKQQFPHLEFKVFHTSTSNQAVQDVEALHSSFNPDLVGLRALSIAANSFKLVSDKIREIMPNIPIIAGGPYPSISYEDILVTGLADLAVIGEGETTFAEVVGHFLKSNNIPLDIKGTAVLKDGKLKLNEPQPVIQDINILPFPDYNYVQLNDYCHLKNHAMQDASKSAYLLSSRGCPYGCFYCHQLFGKRIRRRTGENVIAEMRDHIDKRGIVDFVFLDDIFNVPMPEAKKVLKAIINELPPVRLNFPNGLRADFIDEEMLDLFEQAGTAEMALAVETVVPRLQKLVGKNLDVAKAQIAISAATKRFITRIFFIIGFPTETYEEAMKTLEFAASFEHAAQPSLSVLRLYNNSRLMDILQPNEEQMAMIAEQEKNFLHLKMFNDMEFYGDFFSADKVPLKSPDLKELQYYWMRNVIMNPVRIKNSYQVISKFYDKDQTLEFYRSIFDRVKFSESDLQKLLKFS
ncbi:MAG: radical SAM protein [Bacteroidota bacterium]